MKKRVKKIINEENELSDEKKLEVIHDFLSEIGARGGRAQRGTAQRRELNQRAAEIRWRRNHPKPSKIKAEEILSENA